MGVENFDIGGYATKANVVCSDGRTILPNAFKENDGQKVPLVWNHLHDDPTNVLGHAILENRDDGMYAWCFFNDSEYGKHAKKLVEHNDIKSLSIYANQLVQKKNVVQQGNIREVSLVLSGANPGATIDNVNLAHGEEGVDDEVIIQLGIELDGKKETEVKHADAPNTTSEETVADIIDTMDEKQKNVLYALVANALGGDDVQHSNPEGETFMKKNVFEKEEDGGQTLSHADIKKFAGEVFADVLSKKSTFKEAVIAHAGTYGIDNIEYLFPDARMDGEPTFETRRMAWVSAWMSATRHSPFSRLKKVWADLTEEQARAKGYIKGNEKKEQVFGLLKRSTEPQTIYKKQRLDRDDIIDIEDFDVVAWMWREMRFMLDEEIARAGLVGDGRVFGVDDDAIDPTKIRPIYGDADLFVYYLTLESTVTDPLEIIDAIAAARVNYKGTGTPNFYATNEVITSMFLTRDEDGRRMYKTMAELAAELRVADIIEVEVMEGITRENDDEEVCDLLGILVNPSDYTYGSSKGGKIATFEDFDIDFNQQKYLIETRLSGSLLNPKSAIAVERKQEVVGP